jgi:hypothetical protein
VQFSPVVSEKWDRFKVLAGPHEYMDSFWIFGIALRSFPRTSKSGTDPDTHAETVNFMGKTAICENPKKEIKVERSFFFYIFSSPDRLQTTSLHRSYGFRKSPEDNSAILRNLRAFPVVGFLFSVQDLPRKSRKRPELLAQGVDENEKNH